MSTNNKQNCLNGTVREFYFERCWKQSCPTGTVREFYSARDFDKTDCASDARLCSSSKGCAATQ